MLIGWELIPSLLCLQKEVNIMQKFMVPIWWYELHGKEFIVEADSEDEARSKAFKQFASGDFDSNETLYEYGQYGIDTVKRIGVKYRRIRMGKRFMRVT
jgi:aromatic ring-opening dioxygenase LigB subunit